MDLLFFAALNQKQFRLPSFDDWFSFSPVKPLQKWQANQPAEYSMPKEGKSIHSHALPNYERAEILRDKIEGYALNPSHEPGKHKARVFKSALGFDQSTWELLKQRILDELPYQEARPEHVSQWGASYVVDLPIEGANGNTAWVRTAWIIRPGADYPSLTTVYVLPERK